MKKNTAVVETVENGKKLLSIVPQRLVSGNILRWPNKNAAALIKDRSSAPSSKWHNIPCTLKRKSLKTFAKAKAEAAEMSGENGSDFQQPPPSKKVRTKGAAKQISEVNFNYMMINPGPSTSSTNHQIDPPRHDYDQPSTDEEHSVVQTLESEHPELDTTTMDGEFVIDVAKTYIDEDGLIKEIIAKIDAVKGDIVQEVTKTVTAVMETLISKTVLAIKCDFDEKIASLQLQPKEQEDDLDDFSLNPVLSADELEELEKNLGEKSYAKQVTAYMKNIIGDTADGCNGINTCYQLIDRFIDKSSCPVARGLGLAEGKTRSAPFRNVKTF